MTEVSRGHVFLVRGDLRTLVCDAVGFSGDERNEPSEIWRDAVVGEPTGEGSRVDGQREVRRWSGREGEPTPYVVPVAGDEWQGVDWYLQALRVFLDRAHRDLGSGRGAPPRVAIPLLGGSRGAQAHVRGELLQGTLATLWAFTEQHAVDVALVFDDDESFDAAQWLRRRHGDGAWGALDGALRREADRLAAVALRGDMALFLGAGVSMAAGLPPWEELVRQMALQAGLSGERLEEFERLPMLDRAQWLTCQLGAHELRERVARLIDRPQRPSVAHALLAALPVNEVVTTNYDRLFEIASERLGRPVQVLPYAGALAGPTRWLMKLHGSVDQVDDLVLSRDTFLQYEASRAALSGLLAGLLMTRHVVVVGSSFRDDNVLRITEQVQRLSARCHADQDPDEEPRLGTALAVGLSSVQQELWQGDFHWVDFGRDSFAAGRLLEVFLDRVVAGTSTRTSYLFDERFDRDLSEGDRRLRDALGHLFDDPSAAEHPAVQTLLGQLRERLGWRPSGGGSR